MTKRSKKYIKNKKWMNKCFQNTFLDIMNNSMGLDKYITENGVSPNSFTKQAFSDLEKSLNLPFAKREYHPTIYANSIEQGKKIQEMILKAANENQLQYKNRK